MKKTTEQQAIVLQDKGILKLQCSAEGFGQGTLQFNHGFGTWEFGTGRVGETFDVTDEFLESVLSDNKAVIEKEWVTL